MKRGKGSFGSRLSIEFATCRFLIGYNPWVVRVHRYWAGITNKHLNIGYVPTSLRDGKCLFVICRLQVIGVNAFQSIGS